MPDKFDELIRTGHDTDAMRLLAKQYYDNGKMGHTRKLLLERVADRCDKLQAQLAEVTAERDAAVKDLNDAAPCFACVHFSRNSGTCIGAGRCGYAEPEMSKYPSGFEWRRKEPDNAEN